MRRAVPTYQYACTECDHAFEQVQAFSDDALSECPECRGRLRKLFNAVGVVFKGSGFYRNDSRSPATSSDAATKTESAPAATTETKSESKPAAAASAASSSTSD
jgi:putative FmdB family regulatory protein